MRHGPPLRPLAALFAVALLFMPAIGSELRPFNEGSWQTLARAHKGEPLIVHFWSLSCTPCLSELPRWGVFAARHPGVRIVLVNWDRREQDPARVATALAKAGLVGVETWTLADSFEEKMRFGIDPEWMGELPRTVLKARSGAITAFSGAADFAQISNWLSGQSR